ncbi:MAG: TonB family protein, partial [Flavobacteriales bacterium]|nr:TonB family protein [Flavobacteriales bacterium]
MFCRTCGNQLRETQKFCPKCGTKTTAEPVQAPVESKDSDESTGNVEVPIVQEDPSNVHEGVQIGGAVSIESAEQVSTADSQFKPHVEDTGPRVTETSLNQPKEVLSAGSQTESVSTEPKLNQPKVIEDAMAYQNFDVAEVGESPQNTAFQPQVEGQDVLQDMDSNQVNEESKETPLPDNLVLFIRTKLLEKGAFDQVAKDDLFLRTRASGILDERTEFQLNSELERFAKRAASFKTDIPEEQRPEPKRKLIGFLWTIGVLVLFVSLIGTGYMFRSPLLDTLDGWGLQTKALRDWAGIEKGVQQDEGLKNDTDKIDVSSAVTPSDTLQQKEDGMAEDSPLEEEEKMKAPSESTETNTPRPQSHQSNQVVNRAESAQRPYQQESPSVPTTPSAYKVVDRQPIYPGGTKALDDYINRNLNYPLQARQQRISGNVYLHYVVTATGGVTNVRVAKGVHPLLDEAAIEVVSSITGFTPGYKDGIPVPVEKT